MVSSPVWNWVTGGPAGAALSSADSGCVEADGTLLPEAGALETLDALAEETPLERNGSPEDAARAAAFLCSEAADFITGQVVAVNGGYIV